MNYLKWLLLVVVLAGRPTIADDSLLPPPPAAPPVTRPVKKGTPVVPKFANLKYGDATNNANLLDIYLPEKTDPPVPPFEATTTSWAESGDRDTLRGAAPRVMEVLATSWSGPHAVESPAGQTSSTCVR